MEQLIEQFYKAFQQRDADAMAACYHPQIVFSDPVFPRLQGAQAGAMWKMLLSRGTDLQVTFKDVESDHRHGSAQWEARYTFSQTGRRVHNVVTAYFCFLDGKISEHRDHFSFWRWSAQALGGRGLLLGWTPTVRHRVQQAAGARLAAWIAEHGQPELVRQP